MTTYRKLLVVVFLFLGAMGFAESWGVGAGVAYQQVDEFEDGGMTIVVQAHKNLDTILRNLSIEGETTFTVLYPEDEVFNSSDVSVGFVDFFAVSAGAYAAYSYPILSVLYLKARVGATYVYAEADTTIVGESEVADDTSINLSYGVALGYRLGSRLSFMLDWTQIDPDVFNLGVLMKVHF